MRLFRLAALLWAALVVGATAHAQVIVFDPTNFDKTTITALQSVRQVEEQVRSYVLRLKQYETQLLQLKSINPSTVLGMMGQNNVELQKAMETALALQNLYGSVSTVRNNFTRRIDQAKAMGLAWDKYVEWEQKRIDENVEAAVNMAKEEFKVMERVQRDLNYARTMEGQINSSEGIHQAMQQANLNLNRVLTQGADMARMLSGAAMASGVAVEQVQQQNEDEALMLERMKIMNQRTKRQRSVEMNTLKGLQ